MATTTAATTSKRQAPNLKQAPNPKLAGTAGTFLTRLRRRVKDIRLRPWPPKEFVRLQKTLRPGESISAGNLVLSNNDGALVVRLGEDLAFVVTHQYYGLEFQVRAYNHSPRVISASTPAPAEPQPAPAPPVCEFGPGGSYTRPWPPTSANVTEASDSENVDTLV